MPVLDDCRKRFERPHWAEATSPARRITRTRSWRVPSGVKMRGDYVARRMVSGMGSPNGISIAAKGTGSLWGFDPWLLRLAGNTEVRQRLTSTPH